MTGRIAKVVSVVRAEEGEVMMDLEREVVPESLDHTSSTAISVMTKPATLALGCVLGRLV